MGFSSELVGKVLQENGEDDANIILETLLKYLASEEQVKESSVSLGSLFSSDSDGEVQVPSGSHTLKPYLNSKVNHYGRISRALADMPFFIYGSVVELPEMVFSALKRKEGYVHNLPTETRHHMQSRTPTSTHDQNLILNQLAPVEPDQLEKVRGYPINHTHLADLDPSQRLRTMEHCFQTDTIGYILSPLKDLYPDGLRILSLYTSIGGAEVAPSRLGLHLKCVVSVETSEVNRKIFKSWWESTGQSGELRQIDTVTKLTSQLLREFVSEFGGFDLVVGAHLLKPLVECTHLFFEFSRVVGRLKAIMRGNVREVCHVVTI